MITLKPLSAYTQGAGSTVLLLSEENYKQDGQAALPADALARMLTLNLKTCKVEALKTVTDGQLQGAVFGLLPKDVTYDALEEMLSDVIKQLKALKVEQVDVLLGDSTLQALSGPLYKQLLLADDGFDQYQTTGFMPIDPDKETPDKPGFAPAFTMYLPDSFDLAAEEETLTAAAHMAEGIRTARRLVNEPANVLTPQRLAEEATALADKHGFDIEVYDEKQIQDMGMQAFWSVAKGSDAPPRFLVMRYMNNPETQELLALVGKGLTYDSGGYALKPAAGMETMFCDMGGSAAVIGAISVLASMKARVNVVAVVAACENMISGHAYHNGDIIGSLAGKYIEVVNTDAEGRITLADAITYAATVLNADKIIDIATLTGAVSVALGREITAVVADDEDIYQALVKASDDSGDKVWRLPHADHLAKHNKSERADIKNSGGRPAGTATAALFCRAFAFGKAWGHLDIAGTAYQDKPSAKGPAGATGVGVELLARAAINLFQ